MTVQFGRKPWLSHRWSYYWSFLSEERLGLKVTMAHFILNYPSFAFTFKIVVGWWQPKQTLLQMKCAPLPDPDTYVIIYFCLIYYSSLLMWNILQLFVKYEFREFNIFILSGYIFCCLFQFEMAKPFTFILPVSMSRWPVWITNRRTKWANSYCTSWTTLIKRIGIG